MALLLVVAGVKLHLVHASAAFRGWGSVAVSKMLCPALCVWLKPYRMCQEPRYDDDAVCSSVVAISHLSEQWQLKGKG